MPQSVVASSYSFHKTFVGMPGSHLGNKVSSSLMSIRTASEALKRGELEA